MFLRLPSSYRRASCATLDGVSCGTGIRTQNWGFGLCTSALSFDTKTPWLCFLWACGQPWLCPALLWECSKVHDPGVPSCPLAASHIIFHLIPPLGPPASGAKGSRPVLAAAASQKVSPSAFTSANPFCNQIQNIFFRVVIKELMKSFETPECNRLR